MTLTFKCSTQTIGARPYYLIFKMAAPSGPSTKTHETRKIQLKDVINQIADDSDDATSIQESDSDEYIPSNEEADTDTSDTENTQNSAEDNVAQNIAVENEIEDRPIVDDERHKKTRKRKSRPNTWKKNQRKNKRTAGESYKSDTTGKEVAEKSLKPCDCSRCRLRCNEKLSEERRTELFKQFYALESWSTQTAYISNAILLSIPRQRTVQNPNQSKKQQTRCYYLSTKTDAGELKSVRVCKRMFMATLDINTARIDYALNKKATGQLVDQRGKHVPGNKTPEEDLVLVRQHIEKFPRYISHYTRQHTKKEYLKGVQNVQDMYRLYKMECDVNNKQAVSQWVHKRVFDFQYNLAFHMPKKDTCKTCDINNIKVQTLTDEAEKAEFMKAWDEHKKLADDVRAKLNADKDKCRNSPGEIKVISFDLQKTKALPHVHTNEAYYKRKLGFYNCGIHDCGPDDGYFRMWHEGTASRGPCEVASCLWHYLSSQEQRGNLPEHLVAYSDSCGGQNRNFTMALFWLSVVHYLPCKVVDHIFMVSGHSFLPSDEDFGLDERQQQKYEHVYTPTEWLLIAKRARRNKKAFDVVEMKKENFVDFKELHNFTTNRKVTENGEKVKWMQIRWLRFEKGVLGSFSFKYSVDPDEDFKVVNVNKQGKGRPSRGYVIRKPDTLHALYPEGREISSGKWNDIQDLLKYVPPVHHGFYNGLRSGRDSLETLSDESEVSGESYDERAQSSL